jgi:iron complex outermembrane recepter protein
MEIGKSWLYCIAAAALPILATGAESEDLSRLSLQELGSLQVTSVSKTPELLSEAPAAIYVITQEDIQRSGATSLAEVLRLAPNLLITQLGSSNYVASARGFGGSPDFQSFSNKLLLLIDGRSVYSPLFSGIYLDTQDLLLADISRIEVISGAGSTLWGANAVNGVINVITRPAWLTSGPSAAVTLGDQEHRAFARYGAKAGVDGAYRVYAKAFERDPMRLDDGTSAGDGWRRGQVGFRLDLNQPAGIATVQGDMYTGSNDKAGPGNQSISGANLLGRWQGRKGDSEYQVQGYFDHVLRGAPTDGARFQVETFDLEAQQSVLLGSRHKVVWGGGGRLYRYHVDNTPSLLFLPAKRNLQLWNAFAQDTLSLNPSVKLTVGLKLEYNSHSKWEPQPDIRLAWQASDITMLWASAARAIRAPTPLEVDVVERVDAVDFLVGNPDFQSETVLAYETGFRASVTPAFALSMSAFYNRYHDLRTVEVSDTPNFLPLVWGNRMKGETWGLTGWGRWQVTDRWRLEPGFTLLRKNLKFTEGASGLIGVGQAGNDPRGHALLNSALDLAHNQRLDLSIRYVAKLPEPALPAYTEMSARYAWRVSDAWELSARGVNLLHATHREYPAPSGVQIKRGVFVEARWRP